MTVAVEPVQEQILEAFVARLEALAPELDPRPWYLPRFVTRTFAPLDAVNELPGYIVLDAADESQAEKLGLDEDTTILATMGIELLAYGQGSDADPADRVILRLLADAERVLVQPNLLGAGSEPWTEVENTRRVLSHETEIGPPWRMVKSELYRVRYVYTRGDP